MAARLGDSHGDDPAALKTLESGLRRFPDAPRLDRARALLYRAELAKRLNDDTLAARSAAEVREIHLIDDERALVAEELQEVGRLLAEESSG